MAGVMVCRWCSTARTIPPTPGVCAECGGTRGSISDTEERARAAEAQYQEWLAGMLSPTPDAEEER